MYYRLMTFLININKNQFVTPWLTQHCKDYHDKEQQEQHVQDWWKREQNLSENSVKRNAKTSLHVLKLFCAELKWGKWQNTQVCKQLQIVTKAPVSSGGGGEVWSVGNIGWGSVREVGDKRVGGGISKLVGAGKI